MASGKKNKRSLVRKSATKSSQAKAKPVAKKAARKKPAAMKKAAIKKKLVVKTSTAKKKTLTSKALPKKPSPKKTTATKAESAKRAGRQGRSFEVNKLELQERRSRSAGQSGDLQGLFAGEGADSESVDELLEEGNSFEAGIVAGVEDAGDEEEKEIHTHEVPEDDVPGEYLDKD